MDDVLASKLENIAELPAEELTGLKDQIISEFEQLDTPENRTRESVDRMEVLAEAMLALRNEEGRREAEAQELEALAQKASEVVNGSDSEDSSEDDSEESTDADTAADEIVADDPVEEPVEEEAPAVEEEAPAEVEEVVETPTEDVEEVPAEEEAPAEDTETKDESKDEDEVKDEDKKVNTEFAADPESEPESESETETDTDSDEASADEGEKPEATDEEAETLSNDTSNTESDVETTMNTEFSAPDENAPAVNETVSVKTPTIIAAADVRGISSGSVIPSARALAQAILDRRTSMSRTFGGDGEQALVASIKTDDWYEEARYLNSNDTEGNRNKVEAVVAALQGHNDALVAAGGLYGPVDTSWDIYELGETLGRPVKDSLPSFKADRGGLRFMTPPVLADLEGAVSVWTLQDDIEAAQDGSTKEKPCIRVNAGVEVTVYLEAQPLCLTFGNMGARAYPELVERHISLAMVQQARFAESRILTRIGTLSTQVTAAKQLGVARDILVQVDTAAAALRNRHRLDPEAPLRAIFPVWFKNALRSDLVKQIPGDGQDAALALADATIERWFTERKVTVTWALDAEAGQYFGTQANGALVNFPESVVWYLFPEGTFLFLEEANLDLGIVRDSTLNSTNDYKMFVETFENVAKVGVESLRVTSELAIAGAAAGTVDTIATIA